MKGMSQSHCQETKIFSEVEDQNLLHAKLVKPGSALSKTFGQNTFTKVYLKYSWLAYHLFGKTFGDGVPQLQVQILQELVHRHNDSERFGAKIKRNDRSLEKKLSQRNTSGNKQALQSL